MVRFTFILVFLTKMLNACFVGIGPEISQSVKDVYSAANVRPRLAGGYVHHSHVPSGASEMGGSQRDPYT